MNNNKIIYFPCEEIYAKIIADICNQIDKYVNTFQKTPTCIAMHPDMYEYLLAANSDVIHFCSTLLNLPIKIYNGIDVFEVEVC